MLLADYNKTDYLTQKEDIFDIRQQKYLYIVVKIIIPFTLRKGNSIALKCYVLAEKEQKTQCEQSSGLGRILMCYAFHLEVFAKGVFNFGKSK